jgi:formylmethanofuran dehydrogenase subunit E
VLDVRERASACLPDEPRHYFAQMRAYQTLPDAEMFTISPVTLVTPPTQLISRPGVRTSCARCGEEILNEREMLVDGQTLCRPCARGGYYQTVD